MCAYKEHGENPGYVLQPDYQFSHNGYGLLQLTANYAIDVKYATGSTTQFYRGASFYAGRDELSASLTEYQWTCVKAEEKGRDGRMAYISAQYAAIEEGDFTQVEASMTSAVVAEPIESHPNFTKIQIAAIGDGKTPLGGTWIGNTPPSPNAGDIINPYRAAWGPISTPTPGVVQYNFVNFLPAPSTAATANRKAGVKSWMRPTINLKMTSYMSSGDEAASICSMVGCIAKDHIGVMAIPEAYKTVGENGWLVTAPGVEGGGNKDWLISGANMEVFGGLYKVQLDLLLSGVLGWDPDIYAPQNAG
jgi:hypothetical protein